MFSSTLPLGRVCVCFVRDVRFLAGGQKQFTKSQNGRGRRRRAVRPSVRPSTTRHLTPPNVAVAKPSHELGHLAYIHWIKAALDL